MKDNEPKLFSRRELVKNGIAALGLGTGLFSLGKGLDKFSKTSQKQANADQSNSEEINQQRQLIRRRQEANNAGFKIMGGVIAGSGLRALIDAARR